MSPGTSDTEFPLCMHNAVCVLGRAGAACPTVRGWHGRCNHARHEQPFPASTIQCPRFQTKIEIIKAMGKPREADRRRVLSIHGMYGDLQAIIGSGTLPTLEEMDLPLLASSMGENATAGG